MRLAGAAAPPFCSRPPALGHIHHGPDVFDQFAGPVENRVADDVELSDLAVRMHDSIAMVEICFFPDCFPEAFFSSGPVIGMDAPLEFFKSRRPAGRIEPGYAVYL